MTFVPDDKVFWLKDGRSLNSLHMLKEELPVMADEIFDHHVNDDRNDFAVWVQDCMNEIELADRMKKAKNKFHMKHMVHEHLENKDSASIYDSWKSSIGHLISDHSVKKTNFKFTVWIGVFAVVSLSALVIFFSLLF